MVKRKLFVGALLIAGSTAFIFPNTGVKNYISSTPSSQRVIESSERLIGYDSETSRRHHNNALIMSSTATNVGDPESQPPTPKYGPHLSIKGYCLNAYGILYLLASFGTAFIYYPLLLAAYGYCKGFQRNTMRAVDWVVHMWAKSSMLLMTCKPKIKGLENLPPKGEAVMYIPNHCSYFDIMTLSGFLPRPFKYISKIEVLRIPLIGWAMRMADHVAIRRSDRKSQLQTFKEAVVSLQRGNSIVTFAEGTRSKDGRLQAFKKGPFTMAKKAGVRIVPVSLVNTHVMMPPDCLMPVGVPRNVEIRIHAPIDTKDKTEDELLELTKAAIISGLPQYQQTPALPSTPAPAVQAAPA